jgi:hypothetical protein
MIVTTIKKNVFQSIVLYVKVSQKISFHIEPSEEAEGMGRSVIVVLRTLKEAVDRIECCVGQIYYLLWSPGGKQFGELSVFVERILVSGDIEMNCKFIIRCHRVTVILKPMFMYFIALLITV